MLRSNPYHLTVHDPGFLMVGCPGCEIDTMKAYIEKLKPFARHSVSCQAKRMLDPANHGSQTAGCTCGLAELLPEEGS